MAARICQEREHRPHIPTGQASPDVTAEPQPLPRLGLVSIAVGDVFFGGGMGPWAASALAVVMMLLSCRPASGSMMSEMQGPTAAGGQQSPVSWAGAEGIQRRHSGRRMRPMIGEHSLRLRGGAGGGRQRMIGGNRKGYMLGLKKTDGLEIIREDPMNPPLPRDPDEVERARPLVICGTMCARMRLVSCHLLPACTPGAFRGGTHARCRASTCTSLIL